MEKEHRKIMTGTEIRFVDTHTHLNDEAFVGEEDILVAKAIEAGVGRMILAGTSLKELPSQKALAARHPEHLRMFLGLHPTELTDNPSEALGVIEREVESNPGLYVGIGEIGVDLHESPDDVERQMQAFDRQCRLALSAGLPINIHCRDGLDQVLEVLSGLPRVPRGAFHCFGGTCEDVARIRRVGDFFFGINGIVTFKNSGLREVLPSIGIDRVILETDAPYLAPTPYRGKRNDSSFIPLIAAQVGQTLGIGVEEVGARTTANALELYPDR